MGNPAAPVPSTTILSTWGADVVSRLVPVFADAAARDQALPVPEDGRLCFNIDTGTVEVFTAAGWEPITGATIEHTFGGLLAGSVVTLRGHMVTFAVKASGIVNLGDPLGTMPEWARPSLGDIHLALTYTGTATGANPLGIVVDAAGAIYVSSGRVTADNDNMRGTGSWIVGAKGVT